MEKSFVLSETDKNQYVEEIEKMIDDIIPTIIDFYNKFGIIVKGIKYNSTLEFGGTTKITFDIETDKFYPLLMITVSRLGSAFKSPSERELSGTFVMKGINSDLANMMFTDHGINQILMVKSKKGTMINKVKDLISQVSDKVDVWNGFADAADIFVF